MSRTSLGTLVGLALAALVAAGLGGRVGTGVVAGYLLGASIGLVGFLWQRSLVAEPRKVLYASVFSFLLKLLGLAAGTLALRFVAALGNLADWRAFLFTYAVAAYLSLVGGALENRLAIRQETAL